jgi:hypothetical protein
MARPMLALTCSSRPFQGTRAACTRSSSLRQPLWPSGQPSSSTPNSSPPSPTGALAHALAQAAATACSMASPAGWPSLSLMGLKWSRSMISRAVGAAALDEARRAPSAPTVEQAGQRIVAGGPFQLMATAPGS